MQTEGPGGRHTGWVSIIEGVVGYPSFWFRFWGRDLPYWIEIECEFHDGRYECVRLTCKPQRGGPAVTSEGIRSIPVGKLVTYAARRAMRDESDIRKPARLKAPDTRLGPTEEALELTARVYRAAYAAQYDPTKAVVERFDLPRSTAARWVMKARERGLLGETDERREGI